MTKPTPTPRDKTAAAARRRLRHLRENPLCVECLKLGRTRVAVELDHVVPLHKGGSNDDDNLQGLCRPCHSAKSAQERGFKPRVEIGLDGWPIREGDS